MTANGEKIIYPDEEEEKQRRRAQIGVYTDAFEDFVRTHNPADGTDVRIFARFSRFDDDGPGEFDVGCIEPDEISSTIYLTCKPSRRRRVHRQVKRKGSVLLLCEDTGKGGNVPDLRVRKIRYFDRQA